MIRNMEDQFDYTKAVAELAGIVRKVEDPSTGLDEIDALVARSRDLSRQCREYLRGVKDKIDALDGEETA